MDENYYVLKVKVRENLTDTRAVERMKAWDFTMKEWQSFEKEICPFYNPYAERIVRFFVEYDKVDLCPDLYGSCESSWSMTRWTYVLTYMVHASL